jgi:acetoin:2,6-dichlorophenolindophenol oxidoreductase subunit alpha
VAVFGDGASNIGAFHESLNMAAVWKLPVIFVCENNLYGEYSPLHTTTAVENIADRACAYNIPGVIVDGQDVETVYASTREAVARARKGEGPTLLEIKTYRYRGHSRTDTAPYRPAGELDEWLKRDPIHILRDRMIADGQLDQTEFEELDEATQRKVIEAVEWAKAEPYPPVEAAYQDIYA